MADLTLAQKLLTVQSKLVAPKAQYNSFGKYHYRSCEDILEGVKPLLAEVGATVIISDSIEQIGDRYYLKATARFFDVDQPSEVIEVTALAREASDRKGMDESQITGASSSYARKYALNGLFLIDDTKDADTTNKHERKDRPQPKPQAGEDAEGRDRKAVFAGLNNFASTEQIDPALFTNTAQAILRDSYGVDSCSELSSSDWVGIRKSLQRLCKITLERLQEGRFGEEDVPA